MQWVCIVPFAFGLTNSTYVPSYLGLCHFPQLLRWACFLLFHIVRFYCHILHSILETADLFIVSIVCLPRVSYNWNHIVANILSSLKIDSEPYLQKESHLSLFSEMRECSRSYKWLFHSKNKRKISWHRVLIIFQPHCTDYFIQFWGRWYFSFLR